MPVEAKPLFRPRVVRPRLRAFAPERDLAEGRERLRAWSELLASPAADRQTEQELLPDFLTDVFYRVLGYPGPSGGGGTYTLSRERHVEVDGKLVNEACGLTAEEVDLMWRTAPPRMPIAPPCEEG